ncbi:MAG: DUF4348 domain-containing protein [Bacteroidetes bacterium]|nr:DUF4348 domain-containing protein [Bacteroidota bacterium]
MKAVLTLAIILIQISCSAQKLFRFTAHKIDYTLELPIGYELKKLKDDEGYREHQAIYPDGSVVYITDDDKSGGISKAKEEKYGVNVYTKMLANDNLLLEGTDNNGKYWKEQKLGKVVIGYYNVPPGKKEMYDRVLSTKSQGVDDSFEAFLSKFGNDKEFQKSRVKFPLDFTYYEGVAPPVEVHKGLKMNEWEHIEFLPDSITAKGDGGYTTSVFESSQNRRLIHRAGIDVGISVQYFFEKISGRWFLVKIVNESN